MRGEHDSRMYLKEIDVNVKNWVVLGEDRDLWIDHLTRH